jgi:hypothetical protein
MHTASCLTWLYFRTFLHNKLFPSSHELYHQQKFHSPSVYYLLVHSKCRGCLFHLIALRHTPQSVGLLWVRDRPFAETSTWQHKHCTRTSMLRSGIRTHDLSKRSAADLHVRLRGSWDRLPSTEVIQYVSIHPSIHPCIHICLSVCLPLSLIYASIQPSIYLSIYLSIYIFLCLCVCQETGIPADVTVFVSIRRQGLVL